MNNEELDIEIAKLVFGISIEAVAALPFGVPEFSSDQRWSAAVVGRMLTHDARNIFDEQLERAAIAHGWKSQPEYSGLSTAILVLTPDEICKAALAAIRECGCSLERI